MFCDDVANLEASERSRYADLLVLIAAADCLLVREEILGSEVRLGRAMVYPDARSSIRKGLHDPHRLSNLLKNAEVQTLRFVLRDGALLAAADGDYDKREVRILKQIAKNAEISNDELKQIFDWVSKGWEWHQTASSVLNLSASQQNTLE